MVLLRVGQSEARPLNGLSAEARNGFPYFESGDRCRQKEKSGCGPDEFDGYSAAASDAADFFAKLRITRFGEKPQLIPKARPGWIG